MIIKNLLFANNSSLHNGRHENLKVDLRLKETNDFVFLFRKEIQRMEHDWQIKFIAVFAVLCSITLVSAAYFIDWELFTTSSGKSSA